MPTPSSVPPLSISGSESALPTDLVAALSGGRLNLGGLFAIPLFAGQLEEADLVAFRFAAALAQTRRRALVGEDILIGYLLTISPGDDAAAEALGSCVWSRYADSREREDWLERMDTWGAFGLTEQRENIEHLAADHRLAEQVSISPQLGGLLMSSLDLTHAARPGLPYATRHLLACLIGLPGEQLDPSAIDLLTNLGAGPRYLRPMYRDWLAKKRPSDLQLPLDEVLGVTSEQAQGSWHDYIRIRTLEEALMDEEAAAAADGRNEESNPTTKPPPSSSWQDGVARLSTGMVQFEDERPVQDALGTADYARRFARVIALRGTDLPLSIGLFGEWGAGKTYFMKLLRQEIAALPARGHGDWCRDVAAIRFNAWHYLDSNLWASLVTEIFDQLLSHLAGEGATDQDRLEKAKKLLQKLGKAKGAVAAAEEQQKVVLEQKKVAKKELGNREKVARHVAAKREKEERFLTGALDSLTELLGDKETGWKDAEKTLGLEGVGDSLQALEQRMAEFHSLGGRWRALGLEVTSAVHRKERLWYLAGALIAGPLLAGIIGALPGFWKDWLGRGGMILGQITALITGAVAWFGQQAKWAREQFDRAEEMLRAAQQKRTAMEADPKVIAARARVAKYTKLEAQAAEKVREARATVKKLNEELQELRPERRLYRFIEERAGAQDYRQHLGMVSLVRKDFREMSQLFCEQVTGSSQWQELMGEDKQAKVVDRIVLYVDDLDRCQPQRVVEVLEAVHLLMDFPLFVAVVAVDPRWVKQSLRAHYARLLSGASAELPLPLVAGSALPGPAEMRQATPLDYLEKIFHIPFHLPVMEEEGYQSLIRSLASDVRPQEKAEARSEPATPSGGEAKPEPSKSEPPDESGSGAAEPQNRSRSDGNPGKEIAPDPRTTTVPSRAAAAAPSSPPLGFVHLETWDLEELRRFGRLIHTPRGAKRFINTYRLVRAGLNQDQWTEFRGDAGGGKECRVAMLLLAAAAGSPSAARGWFDVLRKLPKGVIAFDPPLENAPEGWTEFQQAVDALWIEDRNSLTSELFNQWLDRVERFAF